MLIRTHKTTLLQIFCKHSLNSQVIFKSIKVADDTLYRKCEWVKPHGSHGRSLIQYIRLTVAYVPLCFRTYRKRCQGRLRKHLGDLCLLAGQPGEALLHYQTCLDILKSASDWLWLGGEYPVNLQNFAI